MTRLRGKLTYSNVISTLCLVLVLGGGTAYAATHVLPRNSVGSEQIKKEAVTPAKLSKAAKAALRGPQGPEGPQGPQGKEGPQGREGPQGKDGAAGRNLSTTTPLASGETEIGVFAAAGGSSSSAAGQLMTATVDFSRPLAEGLAKSGQVIQKAGEEIKPHCPGIGHADPGYLCVYVGYEENATIITGFEDPQTGIEGVGVGGANAYARTTGTGVGAVAGTWAVTAP